jgi:hypothetical protein
VGVVDLKVHIGQPWELKLMASKDTREETRYCSRTGCSARVVIEYVIKSETVIKMLFSGGGDPDRVAVGLSLPLKKVREASYTHPGEGDVHRIAS